MNEVRYGTGELGSLETPTGRVKRITVEDVRKLKRQTQEQSTVKMTMLRAVYKTWSEMVANIKLAITPRKRSWQCAQYGHKPIRIDTYVFLPKCRYCGVEIDSADQFMTPAGNRGN